jgi:hypothetical protein
MRDLVRRLVEQGLRQADTAGESAPKRRGPPPVIIPPRARPIPAVPRAELRRTEDQEEEAKHARSARR